jgi:hypothetical protein
MKMVQGYLLLCPMKGEGGSENRLNLFFSGLLFFQGSFRLFKFMKFPAQQSLSRLCLPSNISVIHNSMQLCSRETIT